MLCAACRLARQQRAVGAVGAVGAGIRAGVRAGARRSLSQWAVRPGVVAARPLTPTPSPSPTLLARSRFFSSAAAAPPASDPPTTTSTTPAGPPKPDFLDAAESVIWDRLTTAFAPVTALSVRDISGGCGSMYGIEICAEAFRGRGMLQQQRMVNGALGDLMKGWHGVQLKTRAPE